MRYLLSEARKEDEWKKKRNGEKERDEEGKREYIKMGVDIEMNYNKLTIRIL